MTNLKTTIPISEARRRIFEIAGEVQLPDRIYTLTLDGKPKAVIMSAEEYESLKETLSVLEDFPDIQKDIAETDAAFRAGEHKKWKTLDDLKRESGLAVKVKEKSRKKYKG